MKGSEQGKLTVLTVTSNLCNPEKRFKTSSVLLLIHFSHNLSTTEICWIQHYLSRFFIIETFLTRKSGIRTQTRRFLSLLIFTRLQYPMGRHLIQLVYSDIVGTIYCLEEIKLHSHRDIYGINIILQCSLLLIYVYKFCKHNSKKPGCLWMERTFYLVWAED